MVMHVSRKWVDLIVILTILSLFSLSVNAAPCTDYEGGVSKFVRGHVLLTYPFSHFIDDRCDSDKPNHLSEKSCSGGKYVPTTINCGDENIYRWNIACRKGISI